MTLAQCVTLYNQKPILVEVLVSCPQSCLLPFSKLDLGKLFCSKIQIKNQFKLFYTMQTNHVPTFSNAIVAGFTSFFIIQYLAFTQQTENEKNNNSIHMIFKYPIVYGGGNIIAYGHGKYSEKKGNKRWSRNKFGKHIKLDPLKHCKTEQTIHQIIRLRSNFKYIPMFWSVLCVYFSSIIASLCNHVII